MSLPNLKEFVTRTLVDISQAVTDAAHETSKIPHSYTKPQMDKMSEIKFDLAITVSEQNNQNADGGVGFNIQVLKAKIGTDSERVSLSESVSRISFSVPICFAVHEEKK